MAKLPVEKNERGCWKSAVAFPADAKDVAIMSGYSKIPKSAREIEAENAFIRR